MDGDLLVVRRLRGEGRSAVALWLAVVSAVAPSLVVRPAGHGRAVPRRSASRRRARRPSPLGQPTTGALSLAARLADDGGAVLRRAAGSPRCRYPSSIALGGVSCPMRSRGSAGRGLFTRRPAVDVERAKQASRRSVPCSAVPRRCPAVPHRAMPCLGVPRVASRRGGSRRVASRHAMPRAGFERPPGSKERWQRWHAQEGPRLAAWRMRRTAQRLLIPSTLRPHRGFSPSIFCMISLMRLARSIQAVASESSQWSRTVWVKIAIQRSKSGVESVGSPRWALTG